MARIVLIHGFNVKDAGAHTVDKLAPYLEALGHVTEKDTADYGFISLWGVRMNKHSAVIRIVKALAEADTIVAHSNGANYALKALKFISVNRFAVVFLSPAAGRRVKFPQSVDSATVFHTRTDFWVWVSGFLPWLGWGRMGQRGYSGTDPRITNIDFTDVVADHSDWFKDDEACEFFANQIDKVITP